MNNQEKIEKWLAGTLSTEELASFQQTDEYKNLVRMDLALQRFKPAGFDAEASFQKINSRKEKSTKIIPIQTSWPLVMKLAAVLVIGFALVFTLNHTLFKSELKTYATAAGQTLKVVLPDASVVTLNAMSSLSVDEGKWNDSRSITLEGEGFFQVTKGKTFQVKTESGTVTVLGTQFNVKERANFYEVSCHEGKVEVRAKGTPVQLIANQSYREVDKEISQPKLALEETPTWMRSESSFENVPFKEALNELERQYNIVVKAEAIDMNQKFSGKFPNNDLATALKSLTLPLQLTYKIEGKVIVLAHAH
jgi:transmembrane sensor